MSEVLYRHNQILDAKYHVVGTTKTHVILQGTVSGEKVTVTKSDFKNFYTRVTG